MQWIQLKYHMLFIWQIQYGDIQDDGIQNGVQSLNHAINNTNNNNIDENCNRCR